MKGRFMGNHREAYPVRTLCRALRMSRQAYYQSRQGHESVRAAENRCLEDRIRVLYAKHDKRYGSPRITRELHKQGVRCGHNRTARLMRVMGLKTKTARKYKPQTTDSRHVFPVADNLLGQEFRVERPNQVWVSDITYIRTGSHWSYLATILDLFSRQVVGWALEESADHTLVLKALEMAETNRHPEREVIFHSDRGLQYACHGTQAWLAAGGYVASMSRKGNCYDNACAESFFKTLKYELSGQFETFEIARREIFEYIECYYNRVRLHSTLGYVSPVEFETRMIA